MTDLERASRDWYTHFSPEATITGKINALARCLAAARREAVEQAKDDIAQLKGDIEEWRGKLAEQCGKTLAAAYEMRERAKAACHERSQWAASKIGPDEAAGVMWGTYSNACDDCVYFIAALPLAPEAEKPE